MVVRPAGLLLRQSGEPGDDLCDVLCDEIGESAPPRYWGEFAPFLAVHPSSTSEAPRGWNDPAVPRKVGGRRKDWWRFPASLEQPGRISPGPSRDTGKEPSKPAPTGGKTLLQNLQRAIDYCGFQTSMLLSAGVATSASLAFSKHAAAAERFIEPAPLA